MSAYARGRVQIAQARLALLGDYQPDEPAEVTEKREHYQEMLNTALAEINEATRDRLPYKDSD